MVSRYSCCFPDFSQKTVSRIQQTDFYNKGIFPLCTMWDEILTRVSNNDPTLRWIDAMCFLIGDEGCRQISEALMTSNNSFITRINLRLNCIGWEGMKSLSNTFLLNPFAIVELNLGANDLYDEGAYQVARLLESNRTLAKVCVLQYQTKNITDLTSNRTFLRIFI